MATTDTGLKDAALLNMMAQESVIRYEQDRFVNSMRVARMEGASWRDIANALRKDVAHVHRKYAHLMLES